MKYIRTKHTIFEVVDENENVYYVRAKSDRESVYAKSKRNTDIITEGNSIEELCDEFVVIRTDKKYEGMSEILDVAFLNFFEKYNDKDKKLFGAIWTYNGLKYVAKLNNKGELELL